MSRNPLVSILIVAYNPWAYLQNTLRSCVEQSYTNTEILILDNNSTEDISEYIPDDDRIQVFKSEKNLWPYNGLNLLLGKAKWDYIAIQDHDDIWHPEKLEKQVDFLEKHPEYIGSGTNTIMYYEADGKYFEYFLGEKNYYTIHPSLVFRNLGSFRYDTTDTEYMCDAWSLKENLCGGEKKIYNLPEPLTLHLIKKWSGNYSYRWHRLTWTNIKRAYKLHPFGYATMTLAWEIIRKLLYPVLNFFGIGKYIGKIERIPFILTGNTIKQSTKEDWWNQYLGH